MMGASLALSASSEKPSVNASASATSVPVEREKRSTPAKRGGAMRKRWRYVGVYGPDVMLCAARVQIGPLSQAFWAVWDRDERRRFAHTRMRPGGRELMMSGGRIELRGADASASLRFGEAEPVESVCPSGERGFGWTRKRAGVPVRGRVEAGGRSWEVDCLGVDDESAGYHRRHTSWHWSAGVGSAADGRPLAWNLVAGINGPERASERAIWADGLLGIVVGLGCV